MKTSKEGKIKLTKNDLQVGNFVFSVHSESIKLQDISSTVVVKLSRRATVARVIAQAIEEGNEPFLRNYAAMSYYVNGIVPDVEFWQDMNKALTACISRHPELYGQKKDLDDAADAAVIQEEREFHEAVEDLTKESEG